MKKEKEITQRYEKAKKEFLEARAEFNKISDETKTKKLNKKYVDKYFRDKCENYYFVKDVKISDVNILNCIHIMITEDFTCVDFDYQLYINHTSILKKSNKLEFTNALNVAMDRLKTLKNQ